MHKYYSLFFSVLLFLAACRGGSTPTGIIKQQQMTDLLTEIHIIDGSMYSVMQAPDSLYKYGTAKYLATFKKFHTDSAQFRKSFKYYAVNPEKLYAIYEQVTINLKQKTDSLNKLNQKKIADDSKRVADSLKKLPKTPPPTQPLNKGPNPKKNSQAVPY
ncbi:MAG TPA: DUF4296 domain-containing protein [Mucilaginibacter sp.]|nr:DUF4296 domain-containing protein [Mucilaginibacter sp.]